MISRKNFTNCEISVYNVTCTSSLWYPLKIFNYYIFCTNRITFVLLFTNYLFKCLEKLYLKEVIFDQYLK